MARGCNIRTMKYLGELRGTRKIVEGSQNGAATTFLGYSPQIFMSILRQNCAIKGGAKCFHAFKGGRKHIICTHGCT